MKLSVARQYSKSPRRDERERARCFGQARPVARQTLAVSSELNTNFRMKTPGESEFGIEKDFFSKFQQNPLESGLTVSCSEVEVHRS